MNSQPFGVRLRLRADAENVSLVRHGISGVAEAIGMSDAGITDLKTAVTEACTNAVLHAYVPGRPGPMEVDAAVDGQFLKVSVSDFGRGIRPRPDIERSSLRLGLALIAALSSRFEISGGVETGTRVTMYFSILDVVETRSEGDDIGESSDTARPDESESRSPTELAVSDHRLLTPVLSRLVRAIGARHDLPMERLSDAVLLADAISAEDPRAADGTPVHVTIDDDESFISLKVGPLPVGEGAALRERLQIPEIGASLTTLADEVRLDTSRDATGITEADSAEHEYLVFSFRIPDLGRSAV